MIIKEEIDDLLRADFGFNGQEKRNGKVQLKKQK